jgi:hypothetical protein
MPILQQEWDELKSTIYEFWDSQMSKKVDYNAKLYNVQTSDNPVENHMGIGSLDQMQEWKGTVTYQDFKKGFSKGYTHKVYDTGMQLDYRIFQYKQYNKVKQQTALLLDAVYRTLQAHGVGTFNNAFDPTFNGPDGAAVSLCSADHPYSPTDPTKQSNAWTGTDLTMPNLKKVYKGMLDFRNDKGEMVFTMPTILLTGMEYDEEAEKICGPNAGNKEPFTADNDANIYKGRLTHMFHPLITGKKWFLIDPDRMKMFLNWYNARIPVIQSTEDFDTELKKFKVIGEWSHGWDHWDWIAGATND